MSTARFDYDIPVGTRVLFKEESASEALFGEVVSIAEEDDYSEFTYYVKIEDDEKGAKIDNAWEEDGDEGQPSAWMVRLSAGSDSIVRWDQGLATPAPIPQAAPEAPPNPKKLYGAQKPDLALIPPVAELHMAMAFENGAGKYGAYNWRDMPVEAMTYIAAMKRHIGLWLDGQELSSDAAVHNLGHVMACCAILLDSQENGILIDNRPKPGASEAVQNRLKAQKAAALAAKLGE